MFPTFRLKSLRGRNLSVLKAHIGRGTQLARRSANISQVKLAQAVGVHRPTVSSWEREANTATRANVEDVSRAWGMTAESPELLSEEIARGEIGRAAARSRRGVPKSAASKVFRESGPASDARFPLRVPPKAYQLIYERCTTLETAGVPDDVVEEARRSMSVSTSRRVPSTCGCPRHPAAAFAPAVVGHRRPLAGVLGPDRARAS